MKILLLVRSLGFHETFAALTRERIVDKVAASVKANNRCLPMLFPLAAGFNILKINQSLKKHRLMSDFEELDELTHKLNRETARIPWSELQRFFAQGKTLCVDDSLDLIEIARAIVNDDATKIRQLLGDGLLSPVSDSKARAWFEANTEVWAVVSSPWVLVQQTRPDTVKAD